MSIIPVTVPTGAIRYNTDSNKMECFDGTKWWQVAVTYESVSNSGRGMFSGGHNASPGYSNIIDYVTFATTGNAIDFGNLTDARSDVAGCASPIRTVCGGGLTPSRVNLIDWINIPTTGNASDFGDLSEARDHIAGCSNAHGGL